MTVLTWDNQIAKVRVVLASFDTLRKPPEVDEFLRCHGKRHEDIQEDIQKDIQEKLVKDQRKSAAPRLYLISKLI